MCTSFADKIALSPKQYSKPTLVTHGQLCLCQSLHPMLSEKDKEQEIIANDVLLDPNKNVMIITGPNGSGKVRRKRLHHFVHVN